MLACDNIQKISMLVLSEQLWQSQSDFERGTQILVERMPPEN